MKKPLVIATFYRPDQPRYAVCAQCATLFAYGQVHIEQDSQEAAEYFVSCPQCEHDQPVIAN